MSQNPRGRIFHHVSLRWAWAASGCLPASFISRARCSIVVVANKLHSAMNNLFFVVMHEINETITRRWMHHCTILHTAVALDCCIQIILRRRRITLHILYSSLLKDKPICSLSMEDTRVEYWTVWRKVGNAFCMKDRCNRSGRKGAIWWRSEWYIKDTAA